MRLEHLMASAAIAALASGIAHAQDAGADARPAAPVATQNGRTTLYDAAFFVQYAPRSALDIARRVPGFALDLGSTQGGQVDVRGFAGVAGNVVINGARPSSKAETLETLLSRIPAQRVVRVELGPGDLFGADYAGKSQVLNVILSGEGGIDGNTTVSARRIYTGKIVPNGSASVLIRRGQSTVNLSAGAGNNLNHEEGTDTRTFVPSGEREELRRKFNSYHDFNPYVSGSWALERASDNALRVNARYQPGQFDLYQRNHVIPTGEPERDDDLLQDFDNPVFELGGDVTRPLAGGAVKLVGLATRRKRDWLERYRFRSLGGEEVLGGFEQYQEAQRNETILRLNWTKADLAGLSFEAGIEGALNTLDHQVQYFEIQEGGALERIDLPGDEADIREKRAEGFVRVGKQLSSALRVDGGLNYEYSDLTVRGDSLADRTLRFWKPNISLDWRGGSGLHGQLSIRRTVAQLDFYDFISSAELSADRVNAGNASLQPQRAWEFRATLEKPILGDGLVKLDAGYDLVSMLQDRVLIEGDNGRFFDAPGNIGTGKRRFVALTVDAPLTRFGVSGARLKLNGALTRTRVEDPISGEKRNFTGFFPDWEWSADYRQDIGAFSYGFVLSNTDSTTFFRTDEFDSNWNEGVFATAFVEYRPSSRTTITFDVDNALSTRNLRDRLLFDPNRMAPTTIIDELRERNQHRKFGLTFKQSFGSGGGTAGS